MNKAPLMTQSPLDVQVAMNHSSAVNPNGGISNGNAALPLVLPMLPGEVGRLILETMLKAVCVGVRTKKDPRYFQRRIRAAFANGDQWQVHSGGDEDSYFITGDGTYGFSFNWRTRTVVELVYVTGMISGPGSLGNQGTGSSISVSGIGAPR
jgi:hypothetical protein